METKNNMKDLAILISLFTDSLIAMLFWNYILIQSFALDLPSASYWGAFIVVLFTNRIIYRIRHIFH